MAVIHFINRLFVPAVAEEPETIVPAPPGDYKIRPLISDQLDEVVKLNLRCFRKGEHYSKYTFNYLFGEPRVLSYRAVTSDDEMTGFIFLISNSETEAHITTIGVSPEHRNRGIALMLLDHAEKALARRGFHTLALEVRVSNDAANRLYRKAGYLCLRRLEGYYNDGEDAYLMSKDLSAVADSARDLN